MAKEYSDSFRSRNKAQVDAFYRVMADLKMRHDRNTGDWQLWDKEGYAEEFSRLWSGGMRDADAIYQSLLCSKAKKRVNDIL